jgi:hypothetical protein
MRKILHANQLICPQPHNLPPKSGGDAVAKNHPAPTLHLKQPAPESRRNPKRSLKKYF